MAITAPYVFTAGDDATSTRLNTRSSGIAELQSPPRCHAYQTVAQSIPNITATAVLLDSEAVDSEGIHSTAVNTSRMTIVTPGRYRVIGQLGFASNATGYRIADIRINGAGGCQSRSTAINGAASVVQAYDEILCAAGDFIEMYAAQTSGATLALATGAAITFLHIAWCSLT